MPPVSKYRHVFAQQARPDQVWTQIKNSTTIWDLSNFLAASSKHFAFSWQTGGGGRLAVLPLNKPGKVAEVGFLTGHAGPLLDWQFHPFNENLIATASEDATVRIWTVPDEGLQGDITEAAITLKGHGKKVGIIKFSTNTNHMLISAGMDNYIKYWDIEKGERSTIDVMKDQIMSVDYNLDNSMIVTTCRDKKVRIIDPRGNKIVAEANGHMGPKAQKAVWAKKMDKIITTGFSKTQEREVFCWDPRKFDDKYYATELDNASGVMMTFFDEDTNMLYLGGKGDGNIRYFELWDNEPALAPLSELSTGKPQKGLAMLPKMACDTSQCEVARFLKLETDRITPISFQCPRKQAATEFQSDVYPDTFSKIPALTVDEYFSGANKPPNLMSMKDIAENRASASPLTSPASSFNPTEKPFSAADLDAQRAKVAALREQLAKEEEVLAQLEAQAKPATPAAAAE